ncbi:unnamed protein product [Owenia fusiformis]|uniref:VWFA domain-containing protein n=1 Tax=Owenia fusiformis TaxID=6347 RepID=A0A8S4NCF2_OWEFU|nr:unnamed protein product [Owenia fusiformis]
MFHLIRKYVYHDASNVDTTFDAGGKVSVGLTASTIVSQMTWAATLLQSATVAVKYGLSGPLWYAASATMQLFIFATVSIQLKTKAPGAKTFLQVIRVRFGAPTHIVFCVFAAITNIIVTMLLLLGGSAVLTSLTIDLSIEMACVILAAVIGSYTLVGGLGATFYVSYFNVALVFCFLIIMVVEVFLKAPSEDIDLPYGNPETIYNYLHNITGPVGNYDQSYLTIISSGGLMFAIITVVLAFGGIFGDQSYWQSSVAAKPIDGMWGFMVGGIVWFSIPFVLATSFGLSYLAVENWQDTPILSPLEIEQGLVVPAMAQAILGKTGEYVTFLFILMAIMSTGSAEVVAVASLIVYDVYQPYINPFRKHLKEGDCVVCGKPSMKTTKSDNLVDRLICSCKPVVNCTGCAKDVTLRKSGNNLGVHQPYTCTEHGLYKQYQDNLLNYKSWCILWITLFTIPLVLCSHWVGLNLGWVFLFTGIMIGCVVVPIMLSILWSKATSAGMISGVISGCLSGIILCLFSHIGVKCSLTDVDVIKKLLEKKRHSDKNADQVPNVRRYNASSDCFSNTHYLANPDDKCSYFACNRATFRFEKRMCPDGRSSTSKNRKQSKKGRVFESVPCSTRAKECSVRLTKKLAKTVLSVPKVPLCGIDMMIAVDISCSITPMDKLKVRSFLQRLASSLPIGRSKTQLGIVSFDAEVHDVLWLNTAIRSIRAIQAIHRMKLEQKNRKKECGTATYDALTKIKEEYFTEDRGDRKNKPNVVLVVTDGKTVPPERAVDTIEAARALKRAGALMFILALPNLRSMELGQGKFIGWNEWLKMTEPENIFTAADFDVLQSQVTNLTQSFCE